MSHDLSTLNKDFLKRNADNLRSAEINPDPYLPVDLSKPMPADIKSEKELQKQCEQYLTRHGSLRLTVLNVVAEREGTIPRPTCWFFHVKQRAKTRSVILPLQPDLTIYDWAGRRLLVELKVANVFQPGQKEAIDSGLWKLATSFDQFVAIFNDWMASCDH